MEIVENRPAKSKEVIQLVVKDMEAKQVANLITRRSLSGENGTFGYFELEKGAVVPLHHHENEQYTLILKGSVRATIGDKSYSIKAGEIVVIPANIPHTFECLEDGTVDLDFFCSAP